MTCFICRVIGIVDGGSFDQRIITMRVVVGRHQRSLRRQSMQPLRKKQVDLMDMLLNEA